MSETGGDDLSNLTTAAIFDDAVYHTEALRLTEFQHEDALDEHLALAAREAGIEDLYSYLCPKTPDISAAMSTMTVSSVHRSSLSIHSHDTQSTGVTSHLSRMSKDTFYKDQLSPAHSLPLPRMSSSLEYSDLVLQRFRPAGGLRYSSSNASRSGSIFSDVSSLPTPTLPKQKRTKTTGMFSMFRRNSSTCSTPVRHNHAGKSLSPRLDCGHSLSKHAIRIHVDDALESGKGVAPNCCGKPLPRSVLETVLTQKELAKVATRPNIAASPISARDSGWSEDDAANSSSPTDSDSLLGASFPIAPSFTTSNVAQKEAQVPDVVLANKDFKSLRAEEETEFNRIAAFEGSQRKALLAYHQWVLSRLPSQHEKAKAEMIKQHALDLERLEELQLMAEQDLLETQAGELRGSATKLKWMEGYCSNPAQNVKEEDRTKLANYRLVHQKLPAIHESAISVLRGRQEKNTKRRLEKQKQELVKLDQDFEQNKRDEEARFRKDMNRLGELIASRRKTVSGRWELKFEIWRRQFEKREKRRIEGRLPHAQWSQVASEKGEMDPESALAVYLQFLAA
ncbi:hypothetical protein GQ43DRAFT_476657 [Delitschia confertaspora ATCC 74209]|uniref:Uncharacterized protein n=1 Tax=Delitschia confertaspora ATCC 74209 TaxID=1513339 RepID=A0A9P4JG49_9PLEO|nr:hypothetical protein GQ43DRAFT_476657 [Delitschia confertaspora ATCC 74209]